MSASWAEISCTIPNELVDQLASFLVEFTGAGVCIDNLSVDTFSTDDLEETPLKSIKAYLSIGPELEKQVMEITDYLSSLASSSPDFQYSPPVVSVVDQEEWATSWKQHFHTVKIGRRLILKPTWEEFSAEDDQIVIEIDPGMAFGTGSHPTTRLCLEELEKIFDKSPPFDSTHLSSPVDILDVGTGSGILSIGARKLGGGRIVAIDIDPEAIQVAISNLADNNITKDIELSTTPLSLIENSFSIVLANILAEDLIRLAPELTSHMQENGFLILSGILSEKESLVVSAYKDYPLCLVEAVQMDEWSCLVYRLES